MRIINSIPNLPIPMRLFFVICAAAIAMGILVGNAGAQDLDRHTRFEFADGVRPFCADEGNMSVEIPLLSKDLKGGYSTAEEAVDAFVEELHDAAAGGNFSAELRPESVLQLLEPARQFRLSERLDVDNQLIYFDLPSEKQGVLEARIVVENLGDGFFVTGRYLCQSALVSDPVLFEKLWAVEVRKYESQK